MDDMLEMALNRGLDLLWGPRAMEVAMQCRLKSLATRIECRLLWVSFTNDLSAPARLQNEWIVQGVCSGRTLKIFHSQPKMELENLLALDHWEYASYSRVSKTIIKIVQVAPATWTVYRVYGVLWVSLHIRRNNNNYATTTVIMFSKFCLKILQSWRVKFNLHKINLIHSIY